MFSTVSQQVYYVKKAVVHQSKKILRFGNISDSFVKIIELDLAQSLTSIMPTISDLARIIYQG
jgi:hypothetical protein